MFYVYVLKSEKDGKLYIGHSNDLKRRLAEHNDGKSMSTKVRKPFKLVYYEAYASSSDAKYREHQLKRFSGATTHLRKRIKNSLTQGDSM
ncbi:MAG: GIY-YIG nuclease family protein [bacterium]|nr:GIY-YIG nuclease family protein [bacterium]